MKTKTKKTPERPATSTEEAFRNHYKVIAPLIMGSGVGDGQTTACVMAQAATIDALRRGETLDRPTDEMKCACPVLRRLAIRLNDTDWWKDNSERTELLRPLIPLLLDSRGSKELTLKRVFFMADKGVREAVPLRLEMIAKKSGDKQLKKANAEGAKALRELAPIVDKATAEAAREVASKLKTDASADASAYADAYAAASAYADAYAAASAYADAYAAASAASAAASAYADASAAASAAASAYADAYADADRVRLRDLLLKAFRECAAITEPTP